MRVHIPIRLPSLANESHRHWRSLVSIAKKQKEAVFYCFRAAGPNRRTPLEDIPPTPLLVTITRVGPTTLDDDNLAAACKYVRDQIAAEVGVDDGSPLYTWRYEQRKGKYGVDVEIVTR